MTVVIRAAAVQGEQYVAISREASAMAFFSRQTHLQMLGQSLGRVAASHDGMIRPAP